MPNQKLKAQHLFLETLLSDETWFAKNLFLKIPGAKVHKYIDFLSRKHFRQFSRKIRIPDVCLALCMWKSQSVRIEKRENSVNCKGINFLSPHGTGDDCLAQLSPG
jgi:hypothetical protein